MARAKPWSQLSFAERRAQYRKGISPQRYTGLQQQGYSSRKVTAIGAERAELDAKAHSAILAIVRDGASGANAPLTNTTVTERTRIARHHNAVKDFLEKRISENELQRRFGNSVVGREKLHLETRGNVLVYLAATGQLDFDSIYPESGNMTEENAAA